MRPSGTGGRLDLGGAARLHDRDVRPALDAGRHLAHGTAA
jgi:hypothetical protein